MYQRILVPLDGSPFAEQALPHALRVAAPNTGEIHLLSIAPMLGDNSMAVVDLYPVYVYRDYLIDQNEEEARITADLTTYLDQVSAQVQAGGCQAVKVIRFGQPADEIITYAAENNCDLIAMSTHGRSGIGRWVYGSVADKVLRSAAVPVLLVRATDKS